MKMYCISPWGFDIKEVDVIRRTEKSVWIMYGTRERRESDTYYFETWDEAKQAIVDRETRDLQNAERQFEYAKEELEKAIALKPKLK